MIAVITGPTATGKTAVGALLAKTLGGEVISADSMQIYKQMDIGTAKPTKEEMLGVPHHLYDIAEPHESYSVARYISDASNCINDILSRGRVPVLVGGTGLYIESLLSGRSFSFRGDEALRKSLEEEYDLNGGVNMLSKLRVFDPASADKLYPNDKRRIVRAIEVYLTTNKTITQHDLETKSLPPKYSAMKAALSFSDRAVLYSRIDQRVDNMLSAGLEEEVRSLLDGGIPPGSTSMQAIGYKEMASYIKGQLSLDEAVDKIKMESRRYAKRQLSWLRRDSQIRWMLRDEFSGVESIVRRLAEEYEAK
ncbi:MAG: tRNA (adenosine(37)-N6)-dimethylallyltransferase MiaA [Oscillospiraceae bacterium]|nr:tRNA (adenosine(37)-N6)-dimethylallyltransferase MiaA [Oscillospiraceae bacterium]